MKLRLTALAGLAAAATLALAGCGNVSDGPGYTPAPAPVGATAGPTTPASKPAAGKPINLAVATTSLGQTVTLDGRTVYRFDNDTNNPPKSTCEGQCLTAWPPLLTDGTATVVSAEIDSAKVGTLNRPDGSVQVTLNGWPLYLFGQDKALGDVKGEGAANGKWHVIGADGKPLKKS
jgi:predicted lipoprotein with Yx(FWY)xxD motif